MAEGWSDYRPYFHGWRLVQRIPEGSELLPLHGVAYRDWRTAGAVTTVVPLNVLWGWARRAYIWLRFDAVPRWGAFEDAKRNAYKQGACDARAMQRFTGGGR